MNRVFLTLASALFLAFTATAQTTNSLSDAEIKGQQLAEKLCEMAPMENFKGSGILEVRAKGTTTNYPIRFETVVAQTNWLNSFKVILVSNDNSQFFDYKADTVTVTHVNQGGDYYHEEDHFTHATKVDGTMIVEPNGSTMYGISPKRTMAPFANSDFWICDLGLEFFHWPGQKVIKHETKRTRACTVLESTNPDPSPNSYSHVDSWIDDESLGIVHAEAYDSNGKLLKVFDPKSFKKVNGQWELQDMEIRNVQTGSRTWIKFDLNQKS